MHVQTCRVRDRVGVTGALSTQVRLLGSGPIYRYPPIRRFVPTAEVSGSNGYFAPLVDRSPYERRKSVA